jgi:hypothetical protein
MAAFPITVVAPLKRTMLLAAFRRGAVFNAGAGLGGLIVEVTDDISDQVCRKLLSKIFQISFKRWGSLMAAPSTTFYL